MLLEFRTKNYKSFLDEAIFTMIPAPKQKGLDYSILSKKIGNKDYRSVCSSVIYGPNAAGKTNLIGAMETLRSIILRGNIKNCVKDSSNTASYSLELIPNNTLDHKEPVDFYLKFIAADYLVEYSLSIDIGKFLEVNYNRKIITEKLKINDEMIFDRGATLKIGSLKKIEDIIIKEYKENQEGIYSIAKNNLIKDELFLINGFKNMFSSRLVSIILDWLKTKFMIIYHADSIITLPAVNDSKGKSIFINETLEKAAEVFGVKNNKICFVKNEEDKRPKMVSLVKNVNKEINMISAPDYESHGTIRFVNIFPLIMESLRMGGILVIDEFDASIHPVALMNIVTVYHNDEINKNNAQLIFNTHNPIFLNHNIFRRDEIKFIDKDDENQSSYVYSLSDFKTSGKNGVRKNEDFMDNYFVDRYGAIRNIDFSDVIKEGLANDSSEETN